MGAVNICQIEHNQESGAQTIHGMFRYPSNHYQMTMHTLSQVSVVQKQHKEFSMS